jgi:hypothetical protein
MSKRGRIILGAGITVFAGCICLWFFGIQTFSLIQARRIAHQAPVVMLTPIELSDSSISRAPGRKLTYFGYGLEIPWDDLDQQKTRVIKDDKDFAVAMIAFLSGNSIAFWSTPPNGLVGKLQDKPGFDRKVLGHLIGEEAAQSDYDLQRAILEVTPDQLSLLAPKWQALHRQLLLTMKATILARGAEFGIYSVKTKEFQGFQYGRPQNPPKPLSVELFANDRHLNIVFGQKPNGPTIITQADVNRIIQSIHKIQADAN